MNKGLTFTIQPEFNTYLKNSEGVLESNEFTYTYKKEQEQEPVLLAELKIDEKVVGLYLSKNLYGFYSVSKYFTCSKNDFERLTNEDKSKLIEEMCFAISKSSNEEYTYEHYNQIKECFIHEFCFTIRDTGSPVLLKEINNINNIKTVNEDTYFNTFHLCNETELFKVMYDLI